MDFFGVIVAALICLVVLKFLSYLFTTKTKRYNDWVREERRKEFLEIVRSVRSEQGDYRRRATRSVPSTKKAAASARPAARRRK